MEQGAAGRLGWIDLTVEGASDHPSGWIPYFVVRDLDASLAAIADRGGLLLGEVRAAGSTRYTMAADPTGTPFALWKEMP